MKPQKRKLISLSIKVKVKRKQNSVKHFCVENSYIEQVKKFHVLGQHVFSHAHALPKSPVVLAKKMN